MNTCGTMKAHKGCDSSPHTSKNYPSQIPTEPVHLDPSLEVNSGVTMLQYTQLLQQVQTLTVAIQGLQQSILHMPPAPHEVRQPPLQPSSIALVPEHHQHNECSEPRHPTILGLTVESSYNHRSLPSTDLGGIDLSHKVDDMGRQLEALKVRSIRPFEMEFNIEPPFSSQIMSEIIPPKFRML